MRTVDILDAETNPTLVEAMDAVESGAESEIIIARNGSPAVRILPMSSKRSGMLIGLAEGEFKAPTDFDACNEEISGVFEQSRIFPDE